MNPKNIIALFCTISILFFTNNSIAQYGLSVHGYLTQGFAISTDHQIHGIPTTGTSDYRNLALQFRYDLNDQNNFVVQFSHERLGLSPIMILEEDLELDWAYFEYIFSKNVSLRVGKNQMPYGIYNEIRDVGTILPFYRIPYSPYGEGSYMSETVDGFVLKTSTEIIEDWYLDADLFFGRWDWMEWANGPGFKSGEILTEIEVATVEKAAGGQLWIRPPLEGLAFGIGLIKGHAKNGLHFRDDYMGEQDFNMFHCSFDGSFESFLIRSELLYYWLDNHPQNIIAYYTHVGYNIYDNLSINLQTEFSGVYDNIIPSNKLFIFGAEKGDFNHYINHGLGFKYDVFTYLVLKLEYHWFKGFAIEDKFVQFLKDEPYKTQYAIFSIATSF